MAGSAAPRQSESDKAPAEKGVTRWFGTCRRETGVLNVNLKVTLLVACISGIVIVQADNVFNTRL
jgi:hypothetical protein